MCIKKTGDVYVWHSGALSLRGGKRKCALANLPFCANGPALTLLALPYSEIRAMREGRIVVSVFPQLKRICGVASSVAIWRSWRLLVSATPLLLHAVSGREQS